MSEDKTEMVTIEVPLAWAENRAGRGRDEGVYQIVDDSCRKALAARKTKYERWREGFFTDPAHRLASSRRSFLITEQEAKLMAAAPQLCGLLEDVLEEVDRLQEEVTVLRETYGEMEADAMSARYWGHE